MDIIGFYTRRLKEYGDSPKAVSWNSKESQELRFKILCDIGDLRGKTILDYGCGLGDLYRFLKKYKIREYTGYDINQNMILRAIKKYPDGIFRSYLIARKSDYVLASGIFNLRIRNWERKTYKIIEEMFLMSKKGVAINFLSSLTEKKDKISHYAEPSGILRLVGKLTPKFVLRHDYKNNDFTVYLYK